MINYGRFSKFFSVDTYTISLTARSSKLKLILLWNDIAEHVFFDLKLNKKQSETPNLDSQTPKGPVFPNGFPRKQPFQLLSHQGLVEGSLYVD